MKKQINVYGTAVPWDAVAAGYRRTTMKVLALYAREALRSAAVPRGARVLDVACGPGTLSFLAAKTASRVDALDFSKDMLKQLKRRKPRNVVARRGDGQKLPYENNAFDAAFSIFGLMFFPDRKKGFAELYRTLKPGGRAAVTSWAPVSRSPVMKLMFQAIQKMTPEMSAPAKAIRTLEDPRVFRREMAAAGFRDVRIKPVTKPFPLLSPRKFWTFMVEGSAPIVMLRKKMGTKTWKEKEKLAVRHIEAVFHGRRRPWTSQAWLGTGVKPAAHR